MAAVVDEAALFFLLDRLARADVGEQRGERRATPARVDDDVGGDGLAGVRSHPDHVRDVAG